MIAEVRKRYSIGPEFARSYLEYWFSAPDRRRATLAEILALPDPLPMWFEYAFTNNSRGREIFNLLHGEIPPGARRYLDVGCGLGGCLVTFANEGFDVRGIEVDPQRVELAIANCRDYGLSDCVLFESVLAPDLGARLGTFDVITMIDVIEHVEDVPAALERVASLLNPGGILLLEIPNKDSLPAVASDGHFNLFGITQLDRPEAVEYHRCFFDFPYDVGNYFELTRYQSILRDLGCEVRRMSSATHQPRRLRELRRWVVEALSAYFAYRKTHAPRLPAKLRREVSLRFGKYLLGLGRDFLPVVAQSRRALAFKEKYLLDFWTLVAISDGSHSSAVVVGSAPARKGQDEKRPAELEWWQWWLGVHGTGARTAYYREFMLNMGGLNDPSFFDGLICLDIGCGPMGSLTWLTNAKAALGLDPLAEDYLQFDIAKHDMVYLRARAESIPLPSAYVDVVFSMNSLDHIDDFVDACREIRRVLKPGGWFIGSLNLNEPATPTEPWTLTEEMLEEHLFQGWVREFYRVRPKMAELGKEYRYFFEDCPREIEESEGPRALWCRFRAS